MNPFIDIQVSISGTTVTVQYKVDPSFQGRGPFTFNLLAYQDETFTSPLYSIPSLTFYAVDDTSTRQNQLSSFLYKMELTTQDGKVYMSQFFGWQASDSIGRHKYLLASDITRRERVRLNYAGVYVYLLKRQSYSASQLGEVDIITGEPITDDTQAYGVGSTGGYYSPVLTRLSIESKQTKNDYAQDGKGTQYLETMSVRSIGFPFLDQHDIVVTPNGKRFIITDINSTYFPGTTMILIQQQSLRLVPNTDTIYNIAIPSFPNDNTTLSTN